MASQERPKSSSGKSSTSTPPPPPPHDYPPTHASPLNPSGNHTPSPNATPTQKPLPLPPTATPESSSSSSSTPPTTAQITGPALRGRPRGLSLSTVRNPSPSSSHGHTPSASAFPSLERVVSQPVDSLASSRSTLSPSHEHDRTRAQSFTIATLHHSARSSRSPSPAYMSGFGRKGRNETPERAPPQTWWGRPRDDKAVRPWFDPQPMMKERRKRSVPEEQTRAWESTKERVAKALAEVFDVGLDVVHEALRIGADIAEFAPVPGLKEAARTLLGIWDSLQWVELNRLACLRLTERCADILLSVKDEIDQAGDAVKDELQEPMQKLVDAFRSVHNFLIKQMHRPFLKRYLKREEIMREIAGCDTALGDALEMFGIRIQVRILKQIQANEARRQEEASALYESLRQMQHGQRAPLIPAFEGRALPSSSGLLLEGAHVPDQPTIQPMFLPMYSSAPSTPSDTSMSPIDPLLLSPLSHSLSDVEIKDALRKLRERENELDRIHDLDDLRALMRTALETKSDMEMCQVLQVARDEMPEAIKTLQRELEREVRRELREAERGEEVFLEEMPVTEEWSVQETGGSSGLSRGGSTSTDASASGGTDATDRSVAGKSVRTKASVASIGTRVGSRRDTLDREFIEGGLEALKRMSRGTEASLQLPSWTITRYEVDREEKIGIGYFSDVYRGTWRGRAVAIKCLAETTSRALFIHETGIWKKLDHPNVLPLLGASSTSSDPPWFFVSPYCANGSLVEYLKVHEKAGDVDLLKAMHEVARGMEYLHGKGVLHGDLKAANVLVYGEDDLRCVISDFGQSAMRSEIRRMSGSPPPHGTLRWQSPELMLAETQLTPEMDVYAFAICCVEVLSYGKLPWAMQDDITVRHFVVDKKMRPDIPHAKCATSELQKLIRTCWDENPKRRPPFPQIAQDLRQMRVKSGSPDIDPPKLGWRLPSVEEDHTPEASPDPRPSIPLPPVQSEVYPIGSSPSTDASYITAHGTESDSSGHRKYATIPDMSSSTVRPRTAQSEGHATERNWQDTVKSTGTTTTRSSSFSEIEFPLVDSGYVSPVPLNEHMKRTKDERRYRMLLQHEFNANLTLPLWTPTKVVLGAVGYLSKPDGEFMTLFNAFDPVKTSGNLLKGMSPLDTYGSIKRGSQKQDKRTVAQKGWDVIHGLLPVRRNNDGSPQSVARRYTFQLRAEHKTAYLCTETTVYRYIEPDAKHAPYRWFKDNIDRILEVYGQQYGLTREDVYFVIGTLDAPDYALFVSHYHPNGLVHFNVFSGQRNAGQRWGEFELDFSDDALGPGPSYPEELPAGGQARWEKKVSDSKGGQWNTVLLSRLRFKPDATEPTTR